MTGTSARTYRFGDAAAPGVLLGLPLRQAVPVIGGIVWLAGCLQTPLSVPGGLVGLVVGVVVAFGRWRGAPIADTFVPAVRLAVAARIGRRTWCRPPLLGSAGDEVLPPALAGLEFIEAPSPSVSVAGGEAAPMAVVRDRRRHALTAVVEVTGRGFPLAAGPDQDRALGGWGAALSPFARPRSPVVQVTWQAWAGPADRRDHRDFLAAIPSDRHARGDADVLLDYLALVDEQAESERSQRVLVTLTIDDRRVSVRGVAGSRLDAALDVLADELARFRQRLEVAGLAASKPLGAADLTAAVRTRSDPARAGQVTTLSRSLAAAAGRGRIEWGPMAVEADWSHVRVDGSWHRAFRVAGWPQLPVPADWLGALLSEPTVTRTICVVMEPVPITQSARAADREAMAREADAESKGRRGFRITALDRQRLSRVEDRERELAQGHAEFRFTGIVDVTAPNLDALDDAVGSLEQAAAQSLLDLRPLDARHDQAWVAALPLGRNLVSRGQLR
jgi:hypothetical protein